MMAQRKEQRWRRISLADFLQLSEVAQNLLLDAATVLHKESVAGALAAWGKWWGSDAASTFQNLKQHGWIKDDTFTNQGKVVTHNDMRALASRIVTGDIPELPQFVGSRLWYEAGELVQPQQVCACTHCDSMQHLWPNPLHCNCLLLMHCTQTLILAVASTTASNNMIGTMWLCGKTCVLVLATRTRLKLHTESA